MIPLEGEPLEGEKLRLWRLFILGRTVVTGVFVLALGVMNGLVPPASFRPLMLLTGVQFATNGVYLYLWQRRDLEFLTGLCFSLEIILITLLIYFLGSDGYGFTLVYLWPIIMGGWLSGRRAVPALTLLSALGCMTLLILEHHGLVLSDRILLPNGTPLASVLSLPYLLFISLLVWLLTGAMKASENLLREIMGHMAEGVVVIDRDGRVLLANRAANSLLDVYQDRPLPERFQECLRAMQQSSQDVCRWLECHGRTVSISVAELPGTTNTPASTIYVARDITQQIQTEQMKADFVAYASHELRTPLTTIKMLVQLLLMDAPEGGKQRQYLSVIRQQLDRQVRLVNNLLDFTRLEAGKYDLAIEEVELPQVIQTALSVCRLLAEAKQQRLTVDCAADVGKLMANASGLEQVLINLLTNAAKFTPEGGHIRLSCHREGREMALAVEDSGVGMTPEQLQRIFTKFYTVRNPAKRGEGTGLGLVISDMIVKQLGGRIQVQSEVDVGSVFTVWLPADGPSEQADNR